MRPLVLCALGALLIGALGCSSKSTPVHYLDRVEISGATVEDNALLALKPEDVLHLLEQRLTTPAFVRVKPDQELPEGARLYRASLELAFTRETTRSDREGRWAEVGATLTLRRMHAPEPERFELSAIGEERVEGEDLEGRQLALRSALADALSQVATHARLQLDASSKPDQVLVEELSAPEERLRHFAVQALAMRRHPAAVPLMISQLSSEDVTEVRAAVGALVEMREPRAVDALIDLARGKEPAFERELIYAIAAIGHGDAKAYLYTVAQGHDDPTVRTAAQEGVDEIEARASRKPPAGRPEAAR